MREDKMVPYLKYFIISIKKKIIDINVYKFNIQNFINKNKIY